jgi:hypothetical protein
MAVAQDKFTELPEEDPSSEYSADINYIQHDELIKEALLRSIIRELKIPANEKISYVTVLAGQIGCLSGILTRRYGLGC